MNIKLAATQEENEGLDRLLWEVLWEPLGLPRDIRESFKLDELQIELVAIEHNSIIGALVANRLSPDEIEIRHIAVKTGFQKHSVGRQLVEELFRLVMHEAPLRIQTHARNTSTGFFIKLGFQPEGDPVDVEKFKEHGIQMQLMSLKK
jgi:N-acetylglutamate synthase-like GNAT family acetyltransferase